MKRWDQHHLSVWDILFSWSPSVGIMLYLSPKWLHQTIWVREEHSHIIRYYRIQSDPLITEFSVVTLQNQIRWLEHPSLFDMLGLPGNHTVIHHKRGLRRVSGGCAVIISPTPTDQRSSTPALELDARILFCRCRLFQSSLLFPPSGDRCKDKILSFHNWSVLPSTFSLV